MLNRLCHNPDIRREYQVVIQNQLQQGIVEEVIEGTLTNTNARAHYLSHHAVIRKDKQTTKLRIVYDASARLESISLNDSLFSGPKFNQNILDIIARFHTYRIALVADVEKAFLMVLVCSKDRDALRFLWVDDVEKPSAVVKKLRFTRVVFGVSASPFLLNATINHHKFVTNSPIVRQRIALDEQKLPNNSCTNSSVMEEDSTYTSDLLAGSTAGSLKVLGVGWNPVNDVLEFDLREIANSLHSLKPTKRNIVWFASRFYDPLGFVVPCNCNTENFLSGNV